MATIVGLLVVSFGTFAMLAKPSPAAEPEVATPSTPPPRPRTARDMYIGYSAPTGDVDGDGVADIVGWDHSSAAFAFSGKTGALLWEATLPFSGNATPATYEVNGRQFVVIAAGGGYDRRRASGGVYVAFALPK